jgi:hypothetical protein
MKIQIGQLYQKRSDPSTIIMITDIHSAGKMAMTKPLTGNAKGGYRSILSLRNLWIQHN